MSVTNVCKSKNILVGDINMLVQGRLIRPNLALVVQENREKVP